MRPYLLLTAILLAAPAAHASADGLIEGAKQCTQYFPTEERNQTIPVHLLAAISTTETGRYHEGLGMAIPWPWTINVEGKGYYFGTKAEAIAATQKALQQGKRSIDVGCMQVNLKHHASAFRNLNEAFDPATNVAYAAKFLRNNYDEMGNWIKAAAAYHSRTTSKGNSYLGRVEKNWTNIVNKVRAAQGQQQVASAAPAMKEQARDPMPVVRTARYSGRSYNDISMSNGIESAHNVKMIEVNEPVRAQRNDVLVIRTAAAQAVETTPVQASLSMTNGGEMRNDMYVNAPALGTAQTMSIDKGRAANNIARNKTFVFSN